MAFDHTPLPWEHVEATEHHGHYITTAFGTTVCDFYFMLDRSSPFAKRSEKPYGEQVDAAENARGIMLAVNAHNDLVAALKAIDAYWTEDFPEGPDGDPHCKSGLPALLKAELSESTIVLWRQIRAALSKAAGSTEEAAQ